MRTLLDLCGDPQAFGPWFRDRQTWAAWFAFLAALFGLPLDGDGLDTFRRCTGRAAPPKEAVREAWLVVGRRGGKSFILALIAVFLACFRDWRPYLAPGERATVVIIAADRRQARVILRYVKALLNGVPMLRRMIEREQAEAVDLARQVTIEVHTCNFRTVRGYTVVAALLDELAFWRTDDSANPDHEIISALKPAMATIPGAMLLCASSPYARRGALYKAHRKHFGRDGPVLVWQADTRTMNPTIPAATIAEAYEDDPSSAAAEYGAEFRRDIESYIAPEVVDACTVQGRHELAPVDGTTYLAFTDPSGGSVDSMTLAIAHRDGDRIVLDALRERRAPFSPEAVVADFAPTLQTYRIGTVHGDRYAGEWPRAAFRKHGVNYALAQKPKSDLYRDLLPKLNAGAVELLDDSRLSRQLVSLERRTSRAGKDSIDHPPSAHDDLSNVLAGVVSLAAAPIFTRRTLRMRIA